MILDANGEPLTLDTPISKIELSVRIANCFHNNDITTLRQADEMTDAELLRIPNFAHKSLAELRGIIAAITSPNAASIPPSKPQRSREEILEQRVKALTTTVNQLKRDNENYERRILALRENVSTAVPTARAMEQMNATIHHLRNMVTALGVDMDGFVSELRELARNPQNYELELIRNEISILKCAFANANANADA